LFSLKALLGNREWKSRLRLKYSCCLLFCKVSQNVLYTKLLVKGKILIENSLSRPKLDLGSTGVTQTNFNGQRFTCSIQNHLITTLAWSFFCFKRHDESFNQEVIPIILKISLVDLITLGINYVITIRWNLLHRRFSTFWEHWMYF